jgi:hypothetical protein
MVVEAVLTQVLFVGGKVALEMVVAVAAVAAMQLAAAVVVVVAEVLDKMEVFFQPQPTAAEHMQVAAMEAYQ